jgi:hypothetical protein
LRSLFRSEADLLRKAARPKEKEKEVGKLRGSKWAINKRESKRHSLPAAEIVVVESE